MSTTSKPGARITAAARPVGPIRVTQAELFDLNQKRIAIVMMVTGDLLPRLVMFKGDPFLRASRAIDVVAYDQERPFRADMATFELL